MSDIGDLIARAILARFIIGIVIAAAVAIGLEHLGIWLWHHISLHWSK